jgi:cation:H+ antiporter
MPFTNFLYFAIAVVVMIKSGEWVVKSLSKIASLLKMKEFVIGFILMALSTTMPELFVGITSGINKNASLALGTVLGSNIVNVTLVIGIAAILGRGMKVSLKTVKTDMRYMLAIAAVPVILMLDGQLSRLDGIMLLGVFLFYMGKQIRNIPLFTKLVRNHTHQTMSITELFPKVSAALKSFGIFAVALLRFL